MKNNVFFKNAISLIAGTLIVKVLGILYRIPLTNVLGSSGLGIYQMIFPVYALLLDFSGAGMPSAISKAISSAPIVDRENVAKGYLKASAKVLSVVGLIGTLLLTVFSYPISLLQGNKGAFLGYMFLSPAVFFVSLISCFRGYFQGLIKMNYISRSQVIEQVIKLVLGLVLSYLFMPNVLLAVAGATLGVTVSEVICLIYLYLVYKKHKNQIGIVKDKVKVDNKMIKKLIKLSIPLTAVSLMIPLSHFIDSFLVVNILKTYRQDATSLYGISSGAVHTVIGLPVAICYAFAVITLPSVSQTRNDCDKNAKINQSVLITGIISLFASILCFVFANQIISLLFNSFTVKEKQIAVSLLKLSSPCIILLSVLQTLNSSLVAIDKPYQPVVSLGIGVIIKTLLTIILIKNPFINIYGMAFALIACYFSAVMINFIILIKSGTKNANKTLNALGQKT